MNRLLVNRLILWLLAIITAVTLIENFPQDMSFVPYLGLEVIYALLTALALFFGVFLAEGELSSAHVVGMVAFLSLPAVVQPTMTWAIALGGIAGGLSLVARAGQDMPRGRPTARTARSVVLMTARVTLSFYVATRLYIGIGGRLPLGHAGWEDTVALVAFTLVYVLLYIAVFALEIYSDGQSITRVLRSNTLEVVTVLVFPAPFAILASEISSFALGTVSFAVFIAGLALTIIGPYAINRAQYQLRKQLDELRSLSVMSQAIRANLEIGSLLNMIYLQVANLLDADNFLVALYTQDGKQLEFPLVMRDGQLDHVSTPSHLRNGLIDHVLDTQAPLLISRDVSVEARRMGLSPLPEMISMRSWLGVPLLAGGRCLGAMVVTSHDSNQHFGPDDLRLLNIVGASASIAIENSQFYEQQRTRVTQLATLNNILALLTGTLSPQAVLDTVISSVSTVSEATAVAVYLFWDEAQSALALVRSAGLSTEFSVDPPDPLLWSIGDRQGLNQQAPLVVTDVQSDKRTAHLRHLMSREKKNAWAELPLIVGGVGLGVIVIYFDDARSFTGETTELLRTFANQAAQAISNARLYAIADEALERRVGQLLALASIGHDLTATIDVNTIATLVLNHALDATRTSVGAILLREEGVGNLRLIASRGYPSTVFANPTLTVLGMTGQAYTEKRTILSNDVSRESAYLPLMPITRSQLSVPILRANDAMGVITLESEHPNAFSEDDTQFVSQLANQAVISIDNARLFRRIAEARDRLQVILNTMSEAIVLVDSESSIILANPRVDLIGVKADQVVNQKVEELLDRPNLDLAVRMGFESDQDFRRLLKELRTPGHWVGREPASFPVERDGKSAYIERQIILVRDDSGWTVGMLLVFYDRTEQHELELARENLSSMIVHDLRGPLSAVRASMRLLVEVVPQNSDFRQAVLETTDAGRRAVDKLISRVDSLLDVARMSSGELSLEIQPTPWSPLVDSVCTDLKPLAQDLNISIVAETPEKLLPLAIDADKIERLLSNLVDNALKYSPRSSTVSIRTHAPGTDGAPPDFARVDVMDRGPGIPDDYKEKLFDRFVQIQGRSGTRRGFGLGLAFCRLVAEAHGGRIWIEDNPQGGSIFSFTLPVANDGNAR